MARRSLPPSPIPAVIAPERIPDAIARLQKRIAEIAQLEVRGIDRGNCPQLDAIEAAIDEALVQVFGPNTIEYVRYREAADWYRGRYNYAYEVPQGEIEEAIAASKGKAVALLGQAISSLEERLEFAVERPTATARRESRAFAAGDVVRLKSGGPMMTVRSVEESPQGALVHCDWFVGTDGQSGLFPPSSLSRPAEDAEEVASPAARKSSIKWT